jgi:monoamine oxidase
LVLAGEHAATFTGYMEGAIESGERAAHEVLSARR